MQIAETVINRVVGLSFDGIPTINRSFEGWSVLALHPRKLTCRQF